MRSGKYDTYRNHPSLRSEEKTKNYCHEDKVGYIRYMLKIPDHQKIGHNDIIRKKGNVMRKILQIEKYGKPNLNFLNSGKFDKCRNHPT